MQALKAIAVGACLFFASFIATAECVMGGCTGYVEQLYIEADGGLWLQTSGNETLAGCTADSNIFLRLPGDAPKFKEVYALLLAAQLADRPVFVRLATGSNPCRILYVYMNR